MDRAFSRLVGAALGVLVPFAILTAFTPADRGAAGLTAAPFALPRLLSGHLAAAVPLGLVLASGKGHRLAWMAAGVAVPVVFALWLGPALGYAAAEGWLGFSALSALRSLPAVAMVAPWCLATATRAEADGPGAWPVAAAALLAIVPPGLYADALARGRAKAAEELLATGRVARALPVLTALVEMGGARLEAGETPVEALWSARRALDALRRDNERPLARDAPPAARLRRAVDLVRADRLDEAAALLSPLGASDDNALLMLATVYRDQERWAESDAAYEEALTRLLPRADTAARRGAATAVEGLAFNARESGRPAEAAVALRRGLDELPEEAARFHLLLGRHEAERGRPGAALGHLRTAAELDPGGLGRQAGELSRTLRAQTYGCVLPSRR